MNPANYNNGGGTLGGAKAHGQMQAPQKNDNNSQVMMNYVAKALQSQGPFTGWRAEVSIRDRAVKVYQMLTSLRLIQPRVDLQNAAQAALSLEQKAFKEAREKVDYDKEFKEKLIHIRHTRALQAAVMRNGMIPQERNHQIQASPLPGQQQISMNMNDLNQQVPIQSRQPPQPQPQQAMLQQQQRAQQRPNGSALLTDDLSSLNQTEFELVCRIADQTLSKTSQKDIEKIKINMQNVTPEQKAYLLRKNMDPVTYFFRSQALTQLRRRKRPRRAVMPVSVGVDGPSELRKRHQRQATVLPPILPLGRLQHAGRSQSHDTDERSNKHYNNATYPSPRQSSEGTNKKPRLLVKKTISEDLCGGKDADRLEKLRKFQPCSKRPPFRSDRWRDTSGRALTGRQISKYRVEK